MKRLKYNIGIICLLFSTMCGCNDFLLVDLPRDQLNRSNIFTDAHTAEAAVNGMYALIQSSSERIFTGGLTLYAGMYADELYYFTASARDGFLESKLTDLQDGTLSLYFWQPAYQYIYAANSCLEGMAKGDLDEETRNVVTAEAYFVRSLAYYYLTELFGDVPLILTTGYEENEKKERDPKESVVTQILSDLDRAADLLGAEYRGSNKNRPNRYTILALMARVALQNDRTELAFASSDAIIESKVYRLEATPTVFLRGSQETIFQLARVNANINTWESTFFIPAAVNSTPAYVLQPSLEKSFSAEDKRRTYWVGSRDYNGLELFYPTKYKARTSVLTEDYILFRLAEQYLIRAEAALRIGDLEQVVEDLNVIRERSGLEAISSLLTAEELWEELLQERRHELFAELGHRWFDLKRLNKADEALANIKPQWLPTAINWMIPWSQIRINPLLTQNIGYE